MRRTFALVSISGCAVPAASLEERREAVVYGEDDRKEVFATPALRDVTRAVAAVVPRSAIRYGADGAAQLHARSLAEEEQLCADEPFASQPSIAACTALLVDDNLLLTAGHCFANAWDCQNYLFVFDYAYGEAGKLGALDVYECARARVQENDLQSTTLKRDYAVVELTRPVRGRTPLHARQRALAEGESLTVISATGGVPLKVDSGGRVLDARTMAGDYFALDSDTFHGSSGAPVLDGEAALLGVMVRGASDYWWDAAAGCNRVVHSPADAGHGSAEQASYAAPALKALCDARYPSMRLCGIATACGDAICSPGETPASCTADCAQRAADAGASDAGAPEVQDASAADARTEPTWDSGVPAVAADLDTEQASGCNLASSGAAGWSWLLLALLRRRRPR